MMQRSKETLEAAAERFKSYRDDDHLCDEAGRGAFENYCAQQGYPMDGFDYELAGDSWQAAVSYANTRHAAEVTALRGALKEFAWHRGHCEASMMTPVDYDKKRNTELESQIEEEVPQQALQQLKADVDALAREVERCWKAADMSRDCPHCVENSIDRPQRVRDILAARRKEGK